MPNRKTSKPNESFSCLEILRLGIVEVSHDEVRTHCLQEVRVQHPTQAWRFKLAWNRAVKQCGASECRRQETPGYNVVFIYSPNATRHYLITWRTWNHWQPAHSLLSFATVKTRKSWRKEVTDRKMATGTLVRRRYLCDTHGLAVYVRLSQVQH